MMLDIQSVTVGYGTIPVLREVSIQVKPGQLVAVVGPNGAGKSTLFKTISGVLKPSSGVISIDNKEQPAYLPQLPPRPFAYTVREYLSVGQKQHRWTKFNATFDVDALMEKKITALSAGQWQRVAITKVLSQPSSLILMDEPDAPLDNHWSECLNTVLTDVISEGRVIVVSLHRQDIQNSWKYQSLNLTPIHTS